MGIFMLS